MKYDPLAADDIPARIAELDAIMASHYRYSQEYQDAENERRKRVADLEQIRSAEQMVKYPQERCAHTLLPPLR